MVKRPLEQGFEEEERWRKGNKSLIRNWYYLSTARWCVLLAACFLFYCFSVKPQFSEVRSKPWSYFQDSNV